MSTFTCFRSGELPTAILHASGELNLASAPQLLAAALKCVADQPDAVLIDAAALTAREDMHLTVLITVARHAAGWPSIPILLCTAGPQITDAIQRLGIDRHVNVCASLEEGLIRAARPVLASRLRDRLPPTVGSVTAARRLIVEACHGWRLTHLAPVAALVVTELVSNGVRHAGTSMELSATNTGRHLHVAVRDFAFEPARLVGSDGDFVPGGRGLLIVEGVTTSWGCTPTRDGKVTWATMSTRGRDWSHGGNGGRPGGRGNDAS